jgi:hypothetical protein
MNRAATIALAPFGALYSAAISARSIGYEKRFLKTHEVAVPVISVGNITVGERARHRSSSGSRNDSPTAAETFVSSPAVIVAKTRSNKSLSLTANRFCLTSRTPATKP